MTAPTPEQEQIIALLISAAGNADAVRLASLVHNATTGGGVQMFTRQYLVDAWTARWRHHAQMPGRYRPEQRVNRSLPVLIGVTAVASVGGPDLKVSNPNVCQFLADRVYMAEVSDAQHPMSNTLPVGPETQAAAVTVVLAMVNPSVNAGTAQPQQPITAIPAIPGTPTLPATPAVPAPPTPGKPPKP